MTLLQNIKTTIKYLLKIYASSFNDKNLFFTGRASPKEFLVFFIISFLIINLLNKAVYFLYPYLVYTGSFLEKLENKYIYISNFLYGLGNIYGLFIILPLASLSVRRLHDFNKSGYYAFPLILFIILVNIIPLITGPSAPFPLNILVFFVSFFSENNFYFWFAFVIAPLSSLGIFIYLLWLGLKKGSHRANKYGEVPKY